MGLFRKRVENDNGESLEVYLKERLDSVQTLGDGLKLFKKMCHLDTSSEVDMKLFQYGIWSWTKHRYFEVSFVRQLQFPSSGDEYWQIDLVLSYPVNDKLRGLGKKAFWDEEVEGDFFAAITHDPAFVLLKDAKPEKAAVTRSTT